MSTLPRPQFFSTDVAQIEAEMVAAYEVATGRTLYPAQPERMLIGQWAYREWLLRVAAQEAAEQNLLAFARAPMLDYLGELVGTVRLDATAAVATLRFILSAPQAVAINVPAGTRVQTADGRAVFATDTVLTIPAGAASGDVAATATVTGTAGNGHTAGSVSTILDPVAFVTSAANLATTDGGAAIEDDERYRERIRTAPERYSVAGSVEAYRHHALSVSSAIADVAVTNPLSGVVRLYVLATTGLPSAALLTEVSAAVSGERVRPLTDTVEVVPPTEVPYQITATIYPIQGADPVAVMAGAKAAAQAYRDRLGASLGRDIVPNQIIAALQNVPGVHNVALTSPAARVLTSGEWANGTVALAQGAPADG